MACPFGIQHNHDREVSYRSRLLRNHDRDVAHRLGRSHTPDHGSAEALGDMARLDRDFAEALSENLIRKYDQPGSRFPYASSGKC